LPDFEGKKNLKISIIRKQVPTCANNTLARNPNSFQILVKTSITNPIGSQNWEKETLIPRGWVTYSVFLNTSSCSI
jgi:hypothetical protein